MAKSEKRHTPPSSFEVTVPKAIAPLMEAFHVNEEAAVSLILEAARAIFGHDDNGIDVFSKKDIPTEELEGIISLMKGLKPQDTLETLYAAQIIATHMLGMKKLASTYHEDQRLGLKLLRFSSESMQQLERKRGGGMQNISVTYNYNGSGSSVSQTVIKDK